MENGWKRVGNCAEEFKGRNVCLLLRKNNRIGIKIVERVFIEKENGCMCLKKEGSGNTKRNNMS